MSMIGKIVGGTLGFALGHIPGAIIGAAAGHVYDKFREQGALFTAARQAEIPVDGMMGGMMGGILRGGAMDQLAFTIGIIVLGAKMAKADGRVSREEIETFKRVFLIPPEQEIHIGRLFDQARRDAAGFEPYAHHLARLFRFKPAVLEELLSNLILIAAADSNGLDQIEKDFLIQVARIFGFSEYALNQIAAQCGVDFSAARSGWSGNSDQTRPPPRHDAESHDPYAVLGVTQAASNDNIKSAYRKLIREHHPDKLMAAGMPPDFIAVANEKMKRINAAYDTICKQRGIK